MRRRELFTRGLLGLSGWLLQRRSADGARIDPPTPASVRDPSQAVTGAEWRPAYLGDHQNQTLIVLSDLILPATDTPGAKQALANRFIDQMLAASDVEDQRTFISALAVLDRESLDRFGAAFVYLHGEQQVDVLTRLAAPFGDAARADGRGSQPSPHFVCLKSWISRAYYSSEVGMSELGWNGTVFHGDYEGCPHGDRAHA